MLMQQFEDWKREAKEHVEDLSILDFGDICFDNLGTRASFLYLMEQVYALQVCVEGLIVDNEEICQRLSELNTIAHPKLEKKNEKAQRKKN